MHRVVQCSSAAWSARYVECALAVHAPFGGAHVCARFAGCRELLLCEQPTAMRVDGRHAARTTTAFHYYPNTMVWDFGGWSRPSEKKVAFCAYPKNVHQPWPLALKFPSSFPD